MEKSERMCRTGGETAFTVGDHARALEKQGRKIYHFHVGDIKLPTPKNIIKAMDKAVSEGKTGYCSPSGIPELREAIAKDFGKKRGLEYKLENVSIQPGGKIIIPKFIHAFMNPGDSVLYPNPGYPIYESAIKTEEGNPIPYTFIRTEEGFKIDLDGLKRSINPSVKLLIYNNYSNPTSAVSSQEEMEEIARIAKENDIWILNDTAYDDMRYEAPFRSIVSLPGMQERTINLFTFSKTYRMTGWRLGASIGPKEKIDCFNKLNENYESCTTQFVQWAGIEALTGPQDEVKRGLDILKRRRDFAYPLINEIPGFETFLPQATFYFYVKCNETMERLGVECYDEFWKKILYEESVGVSFTTREHFGAPLENEKDKYVRLSFSGIDEKNIEEGLTRLKKYIQKF